jgi:hypothetical protein
MARTSQAWDLHAPYPVEQSFAFRRKSQLPAATFTSESFLRFYLGCCASAVWALHRANVSHDAPPEFLTGTVCIPVVTRRAFLI